MLILTIRTDKPEAEIGLFEDHSELAYKNWQAHRALTETIHVKIRELLEETAKSWKDIAGIVYYKGPGSFTGLRIGAAVANTLAATNNIPLVCQNGKAWLPRGIKNLQRGKSEVAIPEYGSEAHTTSQTK